MSRFASRALTVGILVALAVGVSYNFIQAAWQVAPASAPAGNIGAPISPTSTSQTKTGDLTLLNNLGTENVIASNVLVAQYNRATGQMRSNWYCDGAGGNCKALPFSGSNLLLQSEKQVFGSANYLTKVKNSAFCGVKTFYDGGCDAGFQAAIRQDASGYWRVVQIRHSTDCDGMPWAVYACLGSADLPAVAPPLDYTWEITSGWSAYSFSFSGRCGDPRPTQTRGVVCRATGGTVAPDAKCAHMAQPQRTRLLVAACSGD